MEYNIVLERFEGPMDLLLDLIKKAEIDIYDIPIFEITNQFLEYIENAKKINLELTSDFLVMASTLLEIKSKMLLPKVKVLNEDEEVEEEDPRKELVEKLLEYQKFKNISEILRQSEEYEKKAIYRLRTEIDFGRNLDLIDDLSLDDLSKAFINILAMGKDEPSLNIIRESFSVEEAQGLLREKSLKSSSFYFTELLEEDYRKAEVITFFLAMLELIKMEIIKARQKNDFSDILIESRIDDE